ncbi:aspartate carbamoyltransferase [Candidatus Woesearchaeota archaeon CG08_land_8_20_14_0_20_43_7]|nr:MAG: aspartate carbamoyltransferase [Candidatus Woesearchaeota archaeon CG08_land_8_20_14_0_20_43_7]
MRLKSKDVISIDDFSKDELLMILRAAEMCEKGFLDGRFSSLLKGKVLATLFFEPSTRTRLSFESAMKRLGGSVIGFADSNTSSATKGETAHDTAKMIESYADIMAVRHNIEGAPRVMAEATMIPVLNAGDGANQHPTQTCLDLYTIKKSKGRLEGLDIGFLGDLKYGRTVHSLVRALMHFDCRMHFISPTELMMPKYIIDDLDKQGVEYHITEDLHKTAGKLDVLYVTRIQKERFGDPLEYEKVKDVYQLDKDILEHIKKDLKIMHPLPRVNEIHIDIDDTGHAIYFEQAKNGVFVRQALLALLLGKGDELMEIGHDE